MRSNRSTGIFPLAPFNTGSTGLFSNILYFIKLQENGCIVGVMSDWYNKISLGYIIYASVMNKHPGGLFRSREKGFSVIQPLFLSNGAPEIQTGNVPEGIGHRAAYIF
jgi:hypothetical protein